jgi:hypothetical protein
VEKDRLGDRLIREVGVLAPPNPEIRQEWLPKGRYPIRVPRGHAGEFVTQLARLEHPRVTTSAESGRDAVRYQVRRGDTLFGIAQRFGVPLAALEARNKSTNAQAVHRAGR